MLLFLSLTSSCKQVTKKIDYNKKTTIRFNNKSRKIKTDTTEISVSTKSWVTYYDDTLLARYSNYNFSDSLVFDLNYIDKTAYGYPFLLTLWNSESKTDSFSVEFEFSKPPEIEYQYFINESEVFFNSDSSNIIFFRDKINRSDSNIYLKAVFFLNGKKWKTFRRKQPIIMVN